MATGILEMDEIQKIAYEEAKKHADNIDAATDAAVRRVSRLAAYEEYIEDLVRQAIRGRVCDCRHAMNVAMRAENNGFGGPAKVTAGVATNSVAMSVYTYMIDGRTLGQIRGDELEEIAESEAARAHGHQFNVKLCRKLMDRVAADKLVCECVKEKELRKIFQEIK